MATTTFSSGTVVASTWLNDVDALRYDDNGSTMVKHTATGTSAVARALNARLMDMVSVKDFGATGNGVTNDTAAINAAKVYACSINAALLFPAGTYLVTPATAQTGAGTYNCAFEIINNMHWFGENGATIKLSDNYSTDATPLELAICSTSAAVSNVSFSGLIFDLNGANNSMSPSRPVTYNSYNHAAIIANGPSGRLSDVLVENCVFKNCAGVCTIVCALVAVGTTPVSGVRWVIRDNLFLNNGVDSSDFTGIYAFCESVVCEGNYFWQDSPPHTVGKTGGATGYEVHGSNQRFVNNYVYNYTLGAYAASNFTDTTLNTVIANNHFYCSDGGIFIYRGTSMTEIKGIIIESNTFYFDGHTYSGQPTYRAAIAFQGQIATQQSAVNNIKIQNNYAINTDNSLLSQFVRWDTVTNVASNVCSNLSITENQVIGFTDGVYIITNAANGMGFTEISRNAFIDFAPDDLANPPHGIYVNATGGFTTLVIKDNSFIDERGSPQFSDGIYLTTGTITDLVLGEQTFKGMTTSKVTVAGGLTLTNRIGGGLTFTGTTATVTDGATVAHSTQMVGFNPRSVLANSTVAGEFLSVTAFDNTTFTAALKKHDNTAGTSQTVHWQVKF
jgi:hypothetical protein